MTSRRGPRQVDRGERSGQTADHHLSLAAEVDHAGSERDRERKGHPDDRDHPGQGVAKARAGERPLEHLPVGQQRIGAGDER